MSTGSTGAQGFPPDVRVQAGNPEALKYGRLWTLEAYRRYAPGEAYVECFLAQARPTPGAHVIDLGCGTGRGGLKLALLGGLQVTLVDFVSNCLDPDIRAMLETQPALRFVKADLEHPLPVAAPYGYCTDVLELIPPDRLNAVLTHILLAAQHVFFSISTQPDACGALIGEPLHLTVQPYAWWLERFHERQCVVHWSQDLGGTCLFYVSAWQSGGGGGRLTDPAKADPMTS